jgi:hypothetical protein
MRIDDYTVVFKGMNKKLYGFFMNMIKRKTSMHGDPHPMIRDMMALTYAEAYRKILKGGLSRLPVERIIFIKASDVFYETFRIPKKKPKLQEIPSHLHNMSNGDPDPYQRLVLKEDMKKLDTLLKEAFRNDSGEGARELLEKLADGVPNKQIRADLEITLTCLTSRIYRLRKKVQEHLTEGY